MALVLMLLAVVILLVALAAIRTTSESVPRVGIAVVVMRDDKILLGRRQGSHGAGYWAMPGGHLEMYETFEECSRRELLEETGMHLTHVEFLTCKNEILRADSKHFACVYMLAHATGEPQLLEPHKCDGWEWFSLDALPTPLFGTLAEFTPELKQRISSS